MFIGRSQQQDGLTCEDSAVEDIFEGNWVKEEPIDKTTKNNKLPSKLNKWEEICKKIIKFKENGLQVFYQKIINFDCY